MKVRMTLAAVALTLTSLVAPGPSAHAVQNQVNSPAWCHDFPFFCY